jgi:hypothetical protein
MLNFIGITSHGYSIGIDIQVIYINLNIQSFNCIWHATVSIETTSGGAGVKRMQFYTLRIQLLVN